MLNRKKMQQNTLKNEGMVLTKLSDIYAIVKIHSDLGCYEVDIFVDKKIMAKAHSKLDGLGYYCRSYDFKCLPNEGRLYIAWG